MNLISSAADLRGTIVPHLLPLSNGYGSEVRRPVVVERRELIITYPTLMSRVFFHSFSNFFSASSCFFSASSWELASFLFFARGAEVAGAAVVFALAPVAVQSGEPQTGVFVRSLPGP